MALFDANCPDYFAPNERYNYVNFLANDPGGYEVCEMDGAIVGAFGLSDVDDATMTLNWIMLHPDSQGMGVGSSIMAHAIKHAVDAGAAELTIAASHRSAPFFGKFGAKTVATIENGWGPGMHRVDMTISL